MKKLLALAVFAVIAPACTSDDQDVKNLDLSIDTQDRVAGEYRHFDTGLQFDFRRDPSVDQHYFILEAENGDHLLTVATAGGWRLVNVLDGTYTSAGPIGGEQKTSGDPDAMTYLFELPEMKLLQPLELALTAHGVDDDLDVMPLSDVMPSSQQLWVPGMMGMH